MKIAILLFVTLGLLVAGCGSQYPSDSVKPLIEIEPNCNTWTICTAPAKTTYNVSGGDCVANLNPEQAQKLFDIFIAKNVKVAMFKCTEQKQVVKPGLTIVEH